MSMLLDRVSLEAMTDTCTPDYLYVPIVTALLQASPAKVVLSTLNPSLVYFFPLR